jgi:hypothetical protein
MLWARLNHAAEIGEYYRTHQSLIPGALLPKGFNTFFA